MKVNISERFVRALSVEKRCTFWDDKLAGFGVRKSPNGAATFIFRARIKRVVREAVIGTYPAFSAAAAREEAKALRRSAERGDDFSRPRAARGALSFGDAVALYFDTAVPLKKRNRYARETRMAIEKNCARILKRPLDSVTEDDIREALAAIVKRGAPHMATNVHAMLGPVFEWFVTERLIAENPVRRVAPPAERQRRRRRPDDAELGYIWRATFALEPPWQAFAQTLVLTGQRISSVAQMEADHLANLGGAQPEWRQPGESMKMDEEWITPLAPALVDVLVGEMARRRAEIEACESDERRAVLVSVPFVFWGGRIGRNGSPRPMSGLSKFRTAWRNAADALRAKDGLPPLKHWQPHDLRRALSSTLGRNGVPLHIAELILDHRSREISGVAAVYQLYQFLSERRAALNQWAEHVVSLGEPATAPQRAAVKQEAS